MKIRTTDTIAAVATPTGEGAIAVVRVSGSDALRIAGRVFRGPESLEKVPTHTVHHGLISSPQGEEIDEVLATVFRGPHSYTGEDSVEISCHGGVLVTQKVLGAILDAGCRQAEPGEFTRRAFLNGKMDLSRAEAVASLIASTSNRAHRASLEQLKGRLAGSIGEIREEMIGLCALLEVDLDFSEEGLEVIGRDDTRRKIADTRNRLVQMAETFKSGRIYRDGLVVVIAGRPNVGKSSLFNALLRENRAIVTPVAGTTRDYLEESISVGGLLVRLTDTAGLREAEGPAEQEGILRSKRSVERADVVMVVDDPAKGSSSVKDLLRDFALGSEQAVVVVRNKIDLLTGVEPHSIRFSEGPYHGNEVWLSAKSGEGVQLLANVLAETVKKENLSAHEGVLITNQRHWSALSAAAQALGAALQSLESGAANELAAFDVRESIATLSEITGEITSEDVLNSIFGHFCIGK